MTLDRLSYDTGASAEAQGNIAAVVSRLEAVINERFALPDASARIKPLDRALLATERRTFSEVTWHWPELDGAEELGLEIEAWLPDRAEAEFLRRYERIAAQRG